MPIAGVPQNVSAPMPVGVDSRDMTAQAYALLPIKPDLGYGVVTDSNAASGFSFIAYYSASSLSAQQITTWTTACAAIVNDPTAPWHVAETVNAQILSALARLRTLQGRIPGALTSMQNVIGRPQVTFATIGAAQTAAQAIQTDIKTVATVLGQAGGTSILDGLNEIATDLLYAAHILAGDYSSAT